MLSVGKWRLGEWRSCGVGLSRSEVGPLSFHRFSRFYVISCTFLQLTVTWKLIGNSYHSVLFVNGKISGNHHHKLENQITVRNRMIATKRAWAVERTGAQTLRPYLRESAANESSSHRDSQCTGCRRLFCRCPLKPVAMMLLWPPFLIYLHHIRELYHVLGFFLSLIPSWSWFVVKCVDQEWEWG